MAIAHTQLFFNNPINVSVQVGDYAYYVNTVNSAQSGQGTLFSINSNNLQEIGRITHVFNENNSIVCQFDCTQVPDTCSAHIPDQDQFIMFLKDNATNVSSILGYYAEVDIRNNSSEKAKLFAVSTEISESSK